MTGELLTAALFVTLGALGFIDTKTRRLPNSLVVTVAAIGVLLLFISSSPLEITPLQALYGCALGAGIPLLISVLYFALTKTVGFGMGDIKLLGALGILFGPSVLTILAFSCLFGSVYGVLARKGTSSFAFGPAIIVATVLFFIL